jgi:hypothetical protein
VLSRDAFNALLPDAVPAGEWRADTESLNQLRSCFRLFDKDGDGGISAEELKNVSCNLGEQTSYEMAQEMIALTHRRTALTVGPMRAHAGAPPVSPPCLVVLAPDACSQVLLKILPSGCSLFHFKLRDGVFARPACLLADL